jgi:four helix bundle protein
MAFIRFQDLEVYKLAEQLEDSVWDIVHEWSLLSRDTVGKQLIRSADSIGANIAEGSGRTTFADNRRFVGMARGSLYETQHWLRRAFKRKLLKPKQTTTLQAILDRLGPKLNAYMRSIGRTPRSK